MALLLKNCPDLARARVLLGRVQAVFESGQLDGGKVLGHGRNGLGLESVALAGEGQDGEEAAAGGDDAAYQEPQLHRQRDQTKAGDLKLNAKLNERPIQLVTSYNLFRFQFKNLMKDGDGQHGREVAHLLLTQQPRVQFLAYPNFFLLMLLRFIYGTAQNSGQRLHNVKGTHLVLASGKLVLQKRLDEKCIASKWLLFLQEQTG